MISFNSSAWASLVATATGFLTCAALPRVACFVPTEIADSPVNAAATLRGNQSQSSPADFEDIFKETQQVLSQNVWNIFSINDVLRNQKNMQFKITNNTGATSDIEYAFMRIV